MNLFIKKKVDIVICTNKNLLILRNLITEIFNQNGNFDISVVVVHQSNSSNLYPSFLRNKKIRYKNIKKKNLSIAKNIGLRLSKSNLISFLDDDVRINKNYLSESFNYINKHKCDLLFSRINQINSKLPLSRNMINSDLNINYFNTNCCLSSSMWINLKNKKKIFFDKDFGLGAKYGSGEETDFIFNFLKKNKKVCYSSKVLIFHPKEFHRLKNLKEIYKKFLSYGVGQGAILKKNYRKFKIISLYLFIISILKSLIATIVFLIIFRKKNFIKYLSLFIGKVIGFKNYIKS